MWNLLSLSRTLSLCLLFSLGVPSRDVCVSLASKLRYAEKKTTASRAPSFPFLYPVAISDGESPRAGVQAFSQDWFIGALLTKACNSAVGFSRELQLAQSMEPFRALSISVVSRGPWMPHKKTYVNDHGLDPCTEAHNTVYCSAWALILFVIMYTGTRTLVRHLAWTELNTCLCMVFTKTF